MDDPTGDLAAHGVSCDQVVMLGCDADLNAIQPTMPRGSLISFSCPVSCRECHRKGMARWVETPGDCPWNDIDDRLDAVTDVCCGANPEDECPRGGPPRTCSPLCAVTFHSLTMDCGEKLLSLAGAANARRFTLFDELCTSDRSVDPMVFLDAIANAQCEVCGNGVLNPDGSEGCDDGELNAEDGDCGLDCQLTCSDDLSPNGACLDQYPQWTGDGISLYRIDVGPAPAAPNSEQTFRWYESQCVAVGLYTLKCGTSYTNNADYFGGDYHSCPAPNSFSCNIGSTTRQRTGWNDAVFFWDSKANGVANGNAAASTDSDNQLVCALGGPANCR